jgi:hypothetical protein
MHARPAKAGRASALAGLQHQGRPADPGLHPTQPVKLDLRDVVADVTRPLELLADWVIFDLAAGAAGTATFVLTPPQLSYYDRSMRLRYDRGMRLRGEPGEAVVMVGRDAPHGSSARIAVTGCPTPVTSC